MKLNALVVDLTMLGPGRLGFPRARLRHVARARRRRRDPELHRRSARSRPAPWCRRLDLEALPPGRGDRPGRGRRPPPAPQPAQRTTRARRRRRARDPPRSVSGVRQRPLGRPHPPRVRAGPDPRRCRGQGARARGDLPARLGLRDGPRRPLGRRLRPQAALEAAKALAGLVATSTPTSGSATASSPRASRARMPTLPAPNADRDFATSNEPRRSRARSDREGARTGSYLSAADAQPLRAFTAFSQVGHLW